MRALLAYLRHAPALARAVHANDPDALAAVHDRIDRAAGRPTFVPPLPPARPADVYDLYAAARHITTGATR